MKSKVIFGTAVIGAAANILSLVMKLKNHNSMFEVILPVFCGLFCLSYVIETMRKNKG